jgi:hypothetical protein
MTIAIILGWLCLGGAVSIGLMACASLVSGRRPGE